MPEENTGKPSGAPPKAAAKKKTKRATKKKAARGKPARGKAPKEPAGTCFVLMPFHPPFDRYYREVIQPAVVSAGLEPQRADSLFLPTPIMGDIWQMIQDAKLLVAVLTDKNPNVFYELGLAHAVGKPVVLVSETMEDVPFDLRALRVIQYDKDAPAWGAALREAIVASLGAALDSPVQAVPPMFQKKVESQAPEELELSERVSALEQRIGAPAPARMSWFNPEAASVYLGSSIDWPTRPPPSRGAAFVAAWAVHQIRDLARDPDDMFDFLAVTLDGSILGEVWQWVTMHTH